MIIYGNSGSDIMKMIWNKKYKLLSIIVVIAVAVMLIGCTPAKKQAKLGNGMNKFWDSLGGKVLTKSKDE
jgi:hypothetical protein